MRRTFRLGLAILGVVVALLAIAPFLIPVDRFRPAIEAKASAALGRAVKVGALSLSVWRGSLEAEALVVADDPAFSPSPFLTARSVIVGVELWPLVVSRSLSITGVTIQNPEVAVMRNDDGLWNYSSLGSASAASGDFSIKRLELKEGRVIVGSTATPRRTTYDHVAVTASDMSLTAAFPVAASAALPGGGTLTLAGTIGPANRTDASLTPVTATVAAERLNLATTGFLDSSVGLGGLLDVKATLASKSGRATLAGSATLSKALLVAGGSPASRPVVVGFDATYNLDNHSGVLNPSTLTIGGATSRLTGTYDVGGENTLVNMKVVGDRMPATDLESFLPALGIRPLNGARLTAGTAAVNLTVVGSTERLVTMGSVGLVNAKLSGFDFGAQVRAISEFTGLRTGRDLDIERLTANVLIAPDGLRIDHFDTVIRAVGHLTGAGTVDARNRLDFKMVAMLNAPIGGAPVGTAGALNDVLGMITGGDAVRSARGQRIPFLVQGTTSDPEFVPDVGGLVVETLRRQMGKSDANPLGALDALFKRK